MGVPPPRQNGGSTFCLPRLFTSFTTTVLLLCKSPEKEFLPVYQVCSHDIELVRLMPDSVDQAEIQSLILIFAWSLCDPGIPKNNKNHLGGKWFSPNVHILPS